LEFGGCIAKSSRRGYFLTVDMGQTWQAHVSTDIPITSSDFWQSEDECSEDLMRWVFRSATNEEIPLFEERLACLREAGRVLYEVSVEFEAPFCQTNSYRDSIVDF
jgi:hypothetical protein